MQAPKLLGLRLSERDFKFMRWFAPAIWVFLAAATIKAALEGQTITAIGNVGLLIVLFCAMIGPFMLRIIDPQKDVALGKVSAIATLLGLMTMVASMLVRFIA